MSFGTNLQFFRKKAEMTQETLAEKMEVSRQTVSKWEQGAALPETEKKIKMCDLFNCDMDTLMRNDAQKCFESDGTEYNRHMNRFTAAICSGVGLILFGVTLLLFLCGMGVSEIIAVMVFMSMLAAAVVLFIVSGIGHNSFIENNKSIGFVYPESRVKSFNRKFPYLIAVPVALIILGVIWIIGMSSLPIPAGLTEDGWSELYVSVFMLLVTVATVTIVYAGMQKDKYNVQKYNKENADTAEKRDSERYGGVIMLSATAIFLFCGFVFNLWHIAWVVFPIGGILCAIVSTILNKK